MPNANFKDPVVLVLFDRLLVRIDHNLRNGARHHWPALSSSLSRTFFLGLTLQGFMQAECRGSCDLKTVEGKTWNGMMAIVETQKTVQGRRLLLLQLPRLVVYRPHY